MHDSFEILNTQSYIFLSGVITTLLTPAGQLKFVLFLCGPNVPHLLIRKDSIEILPLAMSTLSNT